jgi:ABC-type antimicrobial peptide transport system permease subunit
MRERRRSLGLMQALGYGRGMIILLFGVEAFLAALAAMAVGTVGAYAALLLLIPLLTEAAGLPLLFEALATAFPGILWSWLVFAGILAAGTAVMLLRLLRHDPADLLRGA